MTIHDLGPYYVQVRYVVSGEQHTMKFSVSPVGVPLPGEDVDLQTKGGDPVDASVGIGQYIGALKANMTNACTFSSWDLFYKETPEADPVWINAGSFVGATGTHVGTLSPAGQFTASFRTTRGGRFRCQLMGHGFFNDERISGSEMQSTAPWSSLTTYLLGDTNVVKARDGGWPISCIGGITKVNDKLRRKHLT